jgi:type III pantothenate kinase
VSEFLGFQGADLADVTGMVVCSGVPRLTATLREVSERYLGRSALVVEPGVKSGMPIRYDNPREVGPDRIADSVAAFDLYGGPTIVVDFSTAMVFDAVSANGEYLGGAIVPGIEVSLDALFGRAAGLRRVELVEPRSVIGRSSVESVQSGAVYGFASLVEGMIARIEEEIGAECTVVATGSPGGLLTVLSDTIDHFEPWLTLHGLRLIHERNRTD